MSMSLLKKLNQRTPRHYKSYHGLNIGANYSIHHWRRLEINLIPELRTDQGWFGDGKDLVVTVMFDMGKEEICALNSQGHWSKIEKCYEIIKELAC
ncbi:hypothetical protein QVD17_07050 [Tagetes erecta]|uniref:Uncharacterized protein n=1 Tax=Tagetes erecta TaxID=13708 RepID=A0AAD8LFE4_TARER|nr:hypothetical protein QVD17_07050 [Tagetes erecta]